MNRFFLKVAAATIGLTAVVLALSCAGGAGGGNNQNNGNGSPNSTDSNVSLLASADPACNDNGNINGMANAVNAAINNQIKGKLKEQLGNGFTYQVSVAPNGQSLEMVVRGALGDVHSADNKTDYDNFMDFMNIVKKFVRKKCTSKVTFMPMIQTAGGPTTTGGGGFEWYACEDPLHPCSDGHCDTNCNKSTAGNSAANAGSSNANTGGTGNSNSR